jgi:hypothetical protein
MANYSDAQISDAVAQFIKSSIVVKKDALGPIDVSAKYEETLQLFSSTLILDPNSIYYLIFLASNKLNAEVLKAIDLIQDIDIAIQEMSNKSVPITNTGQLGNAASALLTTNSILTQNSAVSEKPLGQYNKAVGSFVVASLAPNIKKDGAIVRPPQAAQAAARADLTSLAPMYIDILSWAARLMTILPIAGGGQFKSLNLQAIALQESLIQARADLISLQKAFEDPATSQDQKIAMTKDAYLRIVAGQAVVNNLSVVEDPLAPRMQSAVATNTTPEIDGYLVRPGPSGTLGPATILCTKSAPWVMTTGINDLLTIAEDGNAPTTYTIPVPTQPSVVSMGIAISYDLHNAIAATLHGSVAAPFTITVDTINTGSPPTPTPVLFEVYVDGVLFFGHIAAGTYTLLQIIPILQGLTDASGNLLSTVVNVADDGSGEVKFTYITPGAHTIMIGEFDPVGHPYTGPLGLTNNPANTGVDANNEIEIDGNLSPALPSGHPSDIIGTLNTWFADSSLPYSAGATTTSINIVNTDHGAQSITMTAKSADRATVLRAYTTLGFFEGQSDENDDVTAADVVKVINDAGKLKATDVMQNFARGTTGTIIGLQTLQVPTGLILQVSPTDHAGDMLYVLNGINVGYYRIVSITTSGLYDLILVESTTTFLTPYTANVGWSVVRETVELESKATDLTTAIDIRDASANTTLGLTVGKVVGTTTGFQVKKSGVAQNFTSADVAVGDYVQLGTTDYDPNLPHYLVGSLSSPTQIELALGSEFVMPYIDPLPQQFVIISADYIAYYQFVQGMNEWRKATEASKYSKDIQELERVMNPLLVNTNPSDGQIKDARFYGTFPLLLDPDPTKRLLPPLRDALKKFVTRTSSRIDAAIKMLQERGFDRAYNTLMDGDLVSFFGYDKDDAASGAYMLKTMRSLAQNDLAVSKSNNTMDDTSLQSSSTTTNANYDYSDGDKDENIKLIGNAPVPDASDPSVPANYTKTSLG